MLDHQLAFDIDLDVIYDKFDPASNSLSDHVMGWVIGDRQKGVQFTENMLVNGTDLTAIGELVLNTTDKSISLQEPTNGCDYFLVKDSSKSLIRRLESGSTALQICLGCIYFYVKSMNPKP